MKKKSGAAKVRSDREVAAEEQESRRAREALALRVRMDTALSLRALVKAQFKLAKIPAAEVCSCFPLSSLLLTYR